MRRMCWTCTSQPCPPEDSGCSLLRNSCMLTNIRVRSPRELSGLAEIASSIDRWTGWPTRRGVRAFERTFKDEWITGKRGPHSALEARIKVHPRTPPGDLKRPADVDAD